MYFVLTHKTEYVSIIIEIESRPNGLPLVVLDHSVTCSGQTEWFFVYHKKPFYLLWNKAITITINWHSAITHITISNIIIWHPSFSQEQNRPTAMCTTLAALRYIFYHILPHPSIYFWKHYEYSGNIPHYTILQKISLCKSAKAYWTVLFDYS